MYSNIITIKVYNLMSHTMKMCERVADKRVREKVSIEEEQRGFMSVRSATEAICALKQVYDKYNEMQRPLHSVFVDFEKAYDTIPKDLSEEKTLPSEVYCNHPRDV